MSGMDCRTAESMVTRFIDHSLSVNELEELDDAIVRPGRLGTHIYVGLEVDSNCSWGNLMKKIGRRFYK